MARRWTIEVAAQAENKESDEHKRPVDKGEETGERGVGAKQHRLGADN